MVQKSSQQENISLKSAIGAVYDSVENHCVIFCEKTVTQKKT